MDFTTAEALLFGALLMTACGGALGTGGLIIYQRRTFRDELTRMGARLDQERLDIERKHAAERREWEAERRSYIERITRLETTVAMLTALIPKSSLSVNAAGDATIGGDVIGERKETA